MLFNSLTFIVFFVLVLALHNAPFDWKTKKTNLLIASYGTDKLSIAADRIPADYQPTKPLHFSKTQMPVVGKIDNDSPISNDDRG